MITESEMSRTDIKYKLNNWICAECGEGLAIFFDLKTKGKFLACKRWDRNGHTKIGRPNQEVNKYREESFFMAEQSLAVQSKLAKYQGLTTLNRELSKEIIMTLWPEAEKASPAEVYKAMMLCVQYGLNPLMNHLFLIPFKDKETGKVTFVTVLGIKANRLIASLKHKYTFLDDTPRIMSGDEQMKVYGKIQDDKIIFITKIKDLETGAEAVGRGEWKKLDSWGKANTPKGTDKGNSMENMSATRSERQAYDRLYPADMPDNSIPVVDDAYETVATPRLTSDVIEGESREVEPEPVKSEAPPPPPPAEVKAESGEAQNKGTEKPNLKNAGELMTAVHKNIGKGFSTDTITSELGVEKLSDIKDFNKAYEDLLKLHR